MKSVLEDISSVKKKLKIEISPEDIKIERNRALANIAKKVTIPGFRPGKAPKSVIERHYGEELRSDVMSRLITNAYMAALHEHKLSPVALPEISDISDDSLIKDSPMTFTATVEVRPAIELGQYNEIEIPSDDVVVSDEEVDKTIDRLREMYAELEVVEGRAVQSGDTLIIDFEGASEGRPIPGANATDYTLTLGTGNLIPGFEEQLIGMNRGETREIKVTMPADYTDKDIAGKEALFTVTLKEIKRAVVPELNDEFAKDVGGHENVAELRARIREDLEERKKAEAAAAQREAILAKLIESHTFDVPPSMVEEELNFMLKRHLTSMAKYGSDLKQLDQQKFREENRSLAERRVKGVLLLDAIAEKENVAASESELRAQLAALASSSGMTVEEIKKYYESQDEGLEGLRSAIRRDKTLALLLSRAKKSYN